MPDTSADHRCFRCPSATRQPAPWAWLWCKDAHRETHSSDEPAPIWCPRINHPNRYKDPALDAPKDGRPCPMALCNGTVVYLADGTECCSCTIARFEALYGYRPALQHQPETTDDASR